MSTSYSGESPIDTPPRALADTTTDLSIICHSDLFGPKAPDLSDTMATLFSQEKQTQSVEQKDAAFNVTRITISSLPNETLSAIFDEIRWSTTAQGSTALFNVSYVCTHWRDVAIHSPFLWNRVYFGAPAQSFSETSLFLLRSRECPLDVIVHIPDSSAHHDNLHHIKPPVWSWIHRLAAISAYRWRSLDIHLYDIAILEGCLAPLSELKAPMLTNVRIMLQHGTTHRLVSGFGLKTELLSHIELRGVSFQDFQPCYQHLSLRRLTSLSLTEVVASLQHTQFTSLLAQAPEIERLSILGDVILMGGSSLSPFTTTPIPSLKALTLLPGSLFNFRHLCNSLVIPSVEELSLHHLDADSMGAILQSFHSDTPKCPMLRSLELRAPIDFPDATPSFLAAFPSVTHLSLVAYRPEAHAPITRALALLPPESSETRYCGLLDAFMAVPVNNYPISIPEGSIALLPNLESLGVTPLNEDVFSDLRRVIEYRAKAGAPIQTLRSSTYDRLSKQSRAWLQEQVSLGAI